MEYDNPTSKLLKRILLVILAILTVILMSFATVLLLFSLKAPTSASNTNKNTVATVANVISAYSKPNAIEGLSGKLYINKPQTESVVYYKTDNYDYSVAAHTKKSYIYASTSDISTDDIKTVQDEIKSLLEKQGLKTASYNPDNLGSTSYSTFDNTKVVCQLATLNQKTPNYTSRHYELSCVEKSAIENEYATTEKLLAIYKKTQTISTFTKSTITTNKEGNKAYSILNLIADKTHTRLLFAAINDNWDYLGNLEIDSAKNPGSKYSLTPELKQKISDPKYGDFISKDIH